MAIAHVCANCGRDLARERPQREPHYGLMLIRCPACHAPAVRTAHPIWRRWRSFSRLDAAARVFVLRLVITALLSGLNVFAALTLLAIWSEWRRGGSLIEGEGIFNAFTLLIVIFGLLGPLTGTWLAAAFAHIARWKMWIGWLWWIAFLVLFVALQGPLGSDIDPRDWNTTPLWPWIRDAVVWVTLPAAVGEALILLAALPGIFVGRSMLWATAGVARARWRARLRRRRLIRSAA